MTWIWRWSLAGLLALSVGGGCAPQGAPPLTPPPATVAPRVTRAAASPAPTLLPVTPTPTRALPTSIAATYTVRPGDTLSAIAAAYGMTVDGLLHLNGMSDPDQLLVGQTLRVAQEAEYVGPAGHLLPDSELIYGPAYADFDVAAETAQFKGLFATYTEEVGEEHEALTGPEIVQRIAEQYSVGPRVLLTLLEMRGGWLTQVEPSAEQRLYPLGYTAQDYWDGLYMQLAVAANALNTGFYGWLEDDLWLIQTDDGGLIRYAQSLNAATAGVQRALAAGAPDHAAWLKDLRRFEQVYRRLFGDPFAYAVTPLLPAGAAPELALPWAPGETWYFTGGPHPGWGLGDAWAALDFTTGERELGCQPSRLWATAAAAGPVALSRTGQVWQDLDGDGFLGTGWVLLYMHVATEGRAETGARLEVGDRVGHPSCEGGVSNATHLHLARRYNGVWIAADDARWPLTLSGWTPVSAGEAYDGFLVNGAEEREACECWEDLNAIRRLEPGSGE